MVQRFLQDCMLQYQLPRRLVKNVGHCLRMNNMYELFTNHIWYQAYYQLVLKTCNPIWKDNCCSIDHLSSFLIDDSISKMFTISLFALSLGLNVTKNFFGIWQYFFHFFYIVSLINYNNSVPFACFLDNNVPVVTDGEKGIGFFER